MEPTHEVERHIKPRMQRRNSLDQTLSMVSDTVIVSLHLISVNHSLMFVIAHPSALYQKKLCISTPRKPHPHTSQVRISFILRFKAILWRLFIRPYPNRSRFVPTIRIGIQLYSIYAMPQIPPLDLHIRECSVHRRIVDEACASVLADIESRSGAVLFAITFAIGEVVVVPDDWFGAYREATFREVGRWAEWLQIIREGCGG